MAMKIMDKSTFFLLSKGIINKRINEVQINDKVIRIKRINQLSGMNSASDRPLLDIPVHFRGVALGAQYHKYADAIENFQVRDDDVWIIGFPKTGTTWTREMVWCIGNDLDFEGAKLNIAERCPYLESRAIFGWKTGLEESSELNVPRYLKESIELTNEASSPRFIKTHLPFQLLPRDLREKKTRAKIVYVTRNPKDTAISFYNFRKNVSGASDTLEEFCDMFLENKLLYCPFWDHVLGYLNAQKEYGDQMIILKFTDMKNNICKVIGEVSKFLGKQNLSSESLEILLEHLSFEKMKKNKAVNQENWMENQNKCYDYKRTGEFMRSGQVGEWKSVMPQKISEKFDEKTLSVFKSTNFTF